MKTFLVSSIKIIYLTYAFTYKYNILVIYFGQLLSAFSAKGFCITDVCEITQ